MIFKLNLDVLTAPLNKEIKDLVMKKINWSRGNRGGQK